MIRQDLLESPKLYFFSFILLLIHKSSVISAFVFFNTLNKPGYISFYECMVSSFFLSFFLSGSEALVLLSFFFYCHFYSDHGDVSATHKYCI